MGAREPVAASFAAFTQESRLAVLHSKVLYDSGHDTLF
jgi:hypothetical protein